MEGNEMEMMKEELMKAEQEQLINEAVEAARLEWEKDISARLMAARAEGERIAGMTAEEKLVEREKKLVEREKAMQQKELRARLELRLVEEGLPRALAEAFSYEDEERALRSYQAVVGVFRDAVQEKVSERLGSIEVPKAGQVGDPVKLTDEQYYSMRAGAGMI
ncbi:MAG: DUF4355 domain-containing protein [Clostridia bacterium]|nr:DUF4355 domain-containing protein [Clostridia bacterium]